MTGWEDVGYLLASRLRVETLKVLEDRKSTPSNLAQTLEKSRSTISSLLKGLTERELVQCLNPAQRKGKLYAITDKGKDVLQKTESVLSEEE